VTLLMPEKPVVPQWQRSVFNGLAQIIVKSSKKPGEIKLTRPGAGLTQTVFENRGPIRAPSYRRWR